MKSVKPNFLVIGAEKSGTTWLYNKLSRHSEIYLPLTKECHFFNQYNSNLEVNNNYSKLGWDWYQKFFSDIPQQAKAYGEVTPMYLCDPEAPQRIAQDLPNIKLIYILRNPIERAYSHYWMAFRKGHIKKSFESVVVEKDPRIIQRGNYYEQLEKYYKLFPSKNIRGFVHEYFFRNSSQGLEYIYEFLGVAKEANFEESGHKKILASPKPKSQFVQKIIGITAKKMRSHPLTFSLLDWLKVNGIAPLIKAWNIDSEPYPPIDETLYYKLLDYYISDIERIETKYGLDVKTWKKYHDTD